MGNNCISKINSILPRLALLVIVLASISVNFISFYYIKELETQIDQRDSIISRLTFSNDLVKEYFDIIEDSINQQTIYTLKNEKKTKEVQTETKYVERQLAVEPTFVKGDKIFTTKELLSIVNDGDSIMIDKLKTISEKYNSLVSDYNESQKEIRALKDTVIYQSMALGLIKRNFDIDYSFNSYNNTFHVSLEASKADSAFVIFPYFKHKMKYDEKTKSWTIKK